MLILKCPKCDSANLKHMNGCQLILCQDCSNEEYLCEMNTEEIENTGNIRQINLNSSYWISKDGTRYEFKDMSKEYLKNTINMLKKSYSVDELECSTLFKGLTIAYMLK